MCCIYIQVHDISGGIYINFLKTANNWFTHTHTQTQVPLVIYETGPESYNASYEFENTYCNPKL